MSSGVKIEMVGTSPPSEQPEFHGQWWLPDRPEILVGGKLTFDPTTGGILELFGSLVSRIEAYESGYKPRVIFGETKEHAAVTIADAVFAGSHSRGALFGEKGRTTHESWRCHTLFVGDHLPGGRNTPFTQATLKTNALAAWATESRPDWKASDPDREILELEVPKDLSAELDGATLSLTWLRSHSFGYSSAKVIVEPCLFYKLADGEKRDLEALWAEFVLPSLHFMNFVTHEADKVSRLRVWGEGLEDSGVDVLSTRFFGQQKLNEVDVLQHGIPYLYIKEDFGSLLRSWFALEQKLRMPLLEFFTLSLSSETYLEDKFSRIVRALELWHRAVIGGTWMNEAKFEALRDKLKKSCSEEEWRLVSLRMNYGNELTQRQRLDQLVEMSGEPIAPFLQALRKFTRRIVNRRNELTHGQKGELPEISDEHMAWAVPMLQGIFYTLLIRKLGIGEGRVVELVRKSRYWQFTVDDNNPWFREGSI